MHQAFHDLSDEANAVNKDLIKVTHNFTDDKKEDFYDEDQNQSNQSHDEDLPLRHTKIKN